MNKKIYIRLAFTNIKNNRKTYIPYILTSVLTVMMLFIMHGLARNDSVGEGKIAQILMLASIVIMIFAVIFLFYTNSFLIKRRKKEIGVYNILGMGKGHIAKMLVMETIITAGVSIGFGLLLGLLFSRLMWLLLTRLINYDTRMEYMVHPETLTGTVVLFLIIFVMTLIYNLMQIKLSNPAELLRGGTVGEREPKTKLLLTALGVLLVGAGYYIAVTVESPLAAIQLFFVAVIMVILGTYALFTAGSIAVLKLLRKNKKFYYQSKHFTAVSGMLYRMKQNAAGLANICILSTMVLVLVSTSVSMYLGTEDMLHVRYPKEISVRLYGTAKESEDKIETIISEVADKHKVKMKGQTRTHYGSSAATLSENTIRLAPAGNYGEKDVKEVYMIPREDYIRMTGENIDLEEDEVIFYTTAEETYGWKELQIEDKSYRIVKELHDMWTEPKDDNRLTEGLFLVFSDTEQIEGWLQYIREHSDMREEWIQNICRMRYETSFDLKGEEEACALAEEELGQRIQNEAPEAELDSRELSKREFYGLYGGLLFIGIYLGAMFLMATVLIIYYKQISEGFDDRERYQIMQKVGMGKQEVKRCIRSQVLLVFFLPLAVAVLHVAVAFPVVKKLLALIYLTNESLFLMCTVGTIGVFAVFYAVVYGVTAREYYRIVK
ncbi:MAG: ABC transporter permease [Lachnospiraceae bacterium]